MGCIVASLALLGDANAGWHLAQNKESIENITDGWISFNFYSLFSPHFVGECGGVADQPNVVAAVRDICPRQERRPGGSISV